MAATSQATISDCQVEEVTQLTDGIYRIQLRLLQPLVHRAGQYLELLLDQGQTAVPYTVASAPAALPLLELQIQDLGEGGLASRVIDTFKNQSTVQVRFPRGECYLDQAPQDPSQPIILIGAGTGFSQMKALIEHALAEQMSNPLHLYWGVREAEHLYGHELIEGWQQSHPNFYFHPVVSDPTGDDWSGRIGLVHESVMEDFPQLDKPLIYVCGSPAMVYAVEDDFRERGMGDGQMFSDVYSYAPRS
ncbi:NAD(P)H-flavin reductase [Motiliproteus sp.]|uniref:NAD(P)H-flavin reductase n=1 Tax=Motiliproteus sp. TaxID=1898955 RepID=UPI003BAD88E0